MIKKFFLLMFLFNKFIINYNCSSENISKLSKSDTQELINLVNSIVIRVFSSDALILNGVNSKNFVEWDSLLNCTLEIVKNSDKQDDLKDLYTNYVRDIIDLTNYLKENINYLNNRYSKFFTFDRNQGILKINPEVKISILDKEDIDSYLTAMKSKIMILTDIIKNLIEQINKSDIKNETNKVNQNNFLSGFSIPTNLSKVLNIVKNYNNLKNKEDLDDFFENVVKKYKKIRFFADDLNKLNDFLIASESNFYNKLIPTIQGLIKKIESKYSYLAPIINDFSNEKIFHTKDVVSALILIEADNLKSAYGQIDFELTELIK